MMGYAYILTHPGTPVIFYDHFYDFGLRDQIAELIAVRTRTGVHCRSTVKIFQANFEGYVAQVGEDLVMKIGHLDWNPSKQNNLTGSWEQCIDRDGYQLWERK
jgi:alpha-amylase